MKGVRIHKKGSHPYEIYKPEGNKQYGDITEINGKQTKSHDCDWRGP